MPSPPARGFSISDAEQVLPITQCLVENGYDVFAVDSFPSDALNSLGGRFLGFTAQVSTNPSISDFFGQSSRACASHIAPWELMFHSAALRKSGLTLIDRHTDQWENTYYISEK